MSTQSRAPQMIAASIAGIVVSTAAIVLRIWSRAVSPSTPFWWDDWSAVLAWLFGVAHCALTWYWTTVGFGMHLQDALARGFTMTQIKIPFFANDWLYNTGITFVKLSALGFYARLFRYIPHFRAALWVGAGLTVAWWITFNVLAVTTCNPPEKQWKAHIPGHCLSSQKTFIAAATPNVVIDLYILLLPTPAIWPLPIGLRRRLTVISILALAYCVMIVSIIRVITTVQFQKEGGSDVTWNWVEPEILIIVEMTIGVASICLPTILHLFRRARKHGWRSIFKLRRFDRKFGGPLPAPEYNWNGRLGSSAYAATRGDSVTTVRNDSGIRVQMDFDISSLKPVARESRSTITVSTRS